MQSSHFKTSNQNCPLDAKIFSQVCTMLGSSIGACITEYLINSEFYLRGIEYAVESGASDEIHQLTHPFKSSSAQIGAVSLYNAIEALEAESRQGQHASQQTLEKLQKAQHELKIILNLFLSELKTIPTPGQFHQFNSQTK